VTEEEISKAIDDIARDLHGQGMTPMQVKLLLIAEAERVRLELLNEADDFSI